MRPRAVARPIWAARDALRRARLGSTPLLLSIGTDAARFYASKTQLIGAGFRDCDAALAQLDRAKAAVLPWRAAVLRAIGPELAIGEICFYFVARHRSRDFMPTRLWTGPARPIFRLNLELRRLAILNSGAAAAGGGIRSRGEIKLERIGRGDLTGVDPWDESRVRASATPRGWLSDAAIAAPMIDALRRFVGSCGLWLDGASTVIVTVDAPEFLSSHERLQALKRLRK